MQTSSSVSDPTDWTHVVATYDGATARLYELVLYKRALTGMEATALARGALPARR